MLNHLKFLKAGILKTLYLTLLDFLNAYKFGLKVNKKLIKKQRFTHYLSQGYKLLVLALIIKAKEKGSVLKLVTLGLLLVPFKKVKGLNIKILYSLFLFKSKVPKANKKDFEFNKFISLKDIFITGFLQKCKTRKAFKKSFKKKLNIGLIEPLIFSKANK